MSVNRRSRWTIVIFSMAWSLPGLGRAGADEVDEVQVVVAAKQAAEARFATGDLSGSVLLPDNGDLRRKLDQFRNQNISASPVDSALFLGTLLQNTQIEDFFLASDGQQRSRRSFKARLQQMVAAMSPEGRSQYELQFGPIARKLLTSAASDGDAAVLKEVVRRYFHTEAGYQALFLLGNYCLDHDRPREAALYLDRLRTTLPDQSPREPNLSLLIAACWYRAGESGKATEALARIKQEHRGATVQLAGKEAVKLFGQDAAAAETLQWLVKATGASRPARTPTNWGWTTHRGSPTRNVSAAEGLPLLAPRWYREISGDASVQNSIDRQRQSYYDRDVAALPMLHPLAVDDLVLMPTSQGFQAFDFETGKLLWHYPSDDDVRNVGIEQEIWRQSACVSPCTDGQCVFLTEPDGFSWDSSMVPGQKLGIVRATPSQGQMQNVLSAREIADGRQGNLRWRVGGSDGGDEPQLAGVFFLGSPLPVADRLYVLAEMNSAIRLLVLESLTGKLQWSQDLAVVEQGIATDPFRRMAGATPSIAGDVVVCPTSGGGVVAVDLTMQSLLWAYLYPRAPETRVATRFGSNTRFDQGQRWIDSSVVVGEGHVLLTPLESTEIHCLDLANGQPLWATARNENLYVACIRQGRAVLVGRQHVTALNLSDGQPAWKEPLALPEGSMPSGRGVLGGNHYYLPLSNASIVEIDLDQGKIVQEARSVKQIVPGNLIWHRGVFISLGTSVLEAFDEIEPLRRRVEKTLADNPQDPLALIRRGQLESASGKIDEAIASFRQSYRITQDRRARSLLVAALLDGVRAGGDHSQEWSDELDRLVGP